MISIRRPRMIIDRATDNLSYRARILMSTKISIRAAIVMAIASLTPAFAFASAPKTLPAEALRGSASLYLRQSASSPIHWQPYGAGAFELAARLHRPVLIDDGAVWCHWCHVMDEHTYTDTELAALINREYVPIKLDSDERPDVDGYYQDAAAHLTGAGGWPLTCITTDDGAL